MDSVFETIRLEKDIPVPLYYQLKTQLKSLIEKGGIGEGKMIPPENELCDLLGVSRPTIRQAFSELVNEGFLSRHKGKGTFVSRPKVEDRFFSKLETFNSEMTAKGLTPRTRVLDQKKVTGPHEANEKLKLPLDAPLVYLARLRSVNDVPIVYVETFLPFERFGGLLDVDFTENSLYDSLERLMRVRVNRVRREIEAVNASMKIAELLQIAKNKAVSLVKTVAFADNAAGDASGNAPGNAPVEFSIARYRGDLNKFSIDVYR